MKKLLALLLAMAMMVALVACGGNGGNNTAGNQTDDTTQNDTGNAGNDAQTDEGGEETTGGDAAAVTNADDIPDSMTSEDGKYQVAFVTDVGQLKDKSFNQGTYDGVKLYAAANGLSYKYYQPAGGNEATDDDRYEAMKAAVDAGADVVVCAGYLQETALRQAAIDFPDTKFVFIDGYALDDDPDPEEIGRAHV